MTKKILGFSGSLRKGSCNSGLLHAAQEYLPSNYRLEIFGSLHAIPPFDQDKEMQPHPSVVEFKQKILDADAILIATPEYNYSFSGVLKNAIDWASRPYGQSVWNKKPIAIIGASPAMQGTSRAQTHLRSVFLYLNSKVMGQPEFMVSVAHEKFDKQGKLTDPKTKEKLQEFIDAFVKFMIE